ncbi:MAG: PqqD family peptide modification chaperone [Allosphingosinicella sp.]
MTEDPIVERRDGLIQTEVDGELVALHIENGACYGFNLTATRIWALIETPKRLSELERDLLDEYDVDPQTCREQLREMLEELRLDGLIDLRQASDRS